jgi:hypothetical protein
MKYVILAVILTAGCTTAQLTINGDSDFVDTELMSTDSEFILDTDYDAGNDSGVINFDTDTSSDVDTDTAGTQSCCKLSSEPGCISPEIEQCVCADDDWCCRVKWDGFCIQKANECGGC